jgi:hypothetical protein
MITPPQHHHNTTTTPPQHHQVQFLNQSGADLKQKLTLDSLTTVPSLTMCVCLFATPGAKAKNTRSET